MGSFPQELRDLAKKLEEASSEHNMRLAYYHSAAAENRVDELILSEAAFARRVAAKRAFDAALEKYMESQRG